MAQHSTFCGMLANVESRKKSVDTVKNVFRSLMYLILIPFAFFAATSILVPFFVCVYMCYFLQPKPTRIKVDYATFWFYVDSLDC